MSGPLLSKCQMVARVASLRDPVEMALFDFSSRSLSFALSSHSVFPTLPPLSFFVPFWYADRLTLKRGSHGDKKGPLTSPGTRQTPMQWLRAILKSWPRINRQPVFTYDLFFYLNEDTQKPTAIFTHFRFFSGNFWQPQQTYPLHIGKKTLLDRAMWISLIHFTLNVRRRSSVFLNLDYGESEAKLNILLSSEDSLLQSHYCWLYVFTTLQHETIPAEFILLVSPNALQHLCVSLEKKPLTVIALLHWSPWKWIFKFKSPSTFPFPHPSSLPPRSNLNRNVVTGMLVIPLIIWWNGKTQKHLLRFQSGKGWFSGPKYNKGNQIHTCEFSQNNWRAIYRLDALFFINTIFWA